MAEADLPEETEDDVLRSRQHEHDSQLSRQVLLLSGNLERVKAVVLSAEEMFEQTKKHIERTGSLDPEALRRDIDELQAALTSKRLNVSLDGQIAEQEASFPSRTSMKQHARPSLESEVTVFDLSRSPADEDVDWPETSRFGRHEQDRSLWVPFDRKSKPYTSQKNFISLDNPRHDRKHNLLVFSDRPTERKQRQELTVAHDELLQMLLMQAQTLEKFVER